MEELDVVLIRTKASVRVGQVPPANTVRAALRERALELGIQPGELARYLELMRLLPATRPAMATNLVALGREHGWHAVMEHEFRASGAVMLVVYLLRGNARDGNREEWQARWSARNERPCTGYRRCRVLGLRGNQGWFLSNSEEVHQEVARARAREDERRPDRGAGR